MFLFEAKLQNSDGTESQKNSLTTIQNLSKLAGESADGHVQPASHPNKQGTKCLLLKQVKFISWARAGYHRHSVRHAVQTRWRPENQQKTSGSKWKWRRKNVKIWWFKWKNTQSQTSESPQHRCFTTKEDIITLREQKRQKSRKWHKCAAAWTQNMKERLSTKTQHDSGIKQKYTSVVTHTHTVMCVMMVIWRQ